MAQFVIKNLSRLAEFARGPHKFHLYLFNILNFYSMDRLGQLQQQQQQQQPNEIKSNLNPVPNFNSKKINNKHVTSSPELPAWVHTPSRPLQHSQTLRPNFNPPTNTIPSMLNRTGKTNYVGKFKTNLL